MKQYVQTLLLTAAWAAVGLPAATAQLDEMLDDLDGTKAAKAAAVPKMYVKASTPRFFTSSIEFHDPDEELWPTYLLARAADENGWFQYGDKQHQGQFAVKSHMMAQVDGTQDRRLGGSLVKLREVEGKDGSKHKKPFGPEVLVTVKKMGAVQIDEKTITQKDRGGRPVQRVIKTVWTPVTASIDVDGRVTDAQGKMYVSVKQEENKVIQKMEYVSAPMRLVFDVKGAALGLKKRASKPVTVQVYTEAFAKRASVEDIKQDLGIPTVKKAVEEDADVDLGLDDL